MRIWYAAALASLLLTGCSGPDRPAAAPAAAAVPPPKITQLYAPEPSIATGEKAKICYGVENTKSVWISPPRQELSAALTRCIEVEPTAKTTYTLTAEGADGKQVSQDITIGVGAAKVKIMNVNISAVQVHPGEPVSICYTVANARSVTISPPGYDGGSKAKGCASHQPSKTTTYVIAATGAGGERDEEKVTVTVR
jgi:type IV pilus biogenesis protein CpaD/CtpE